jgi:hypothetical protein
MRHLILPSLVLAALAGNPCRAQPWPVGPDGPFPRIHPGQTELPPGYPPVDNRPSPTPLKDYHRYGRPLGCWASFNGYNCGSLHSEMAFIFGSCRTFFGQPCLKSAPPSPLPPWAYYGAPGAPPPGSSWPGAHPGGMAPGAHGPGGAPQGVPTANGGCSCP